MKHFVYEFYALKFQQVAIATGERQLVKVSSSVMPDSLRPHGLYIVHGILQARILEWITFPSPGDLPNPGIQPRSFTLQEDSLPTESQGKPNNTGMGSRSHLQQIFAIQKLHQVFLHCRRILYQQSYQGSPSWNT